MLVGHACRSSPFQSLVSIAANWSLWPGGLCLLGWTVVFEAWVRVNGRLLRGDPVTLLGASLDGSREEGTRGPHIGSIEDLERSAPDLWPREIAGDESPLSVPSPALLRTVVRDA